MDPLSTSLTAELTATVIEISPIVARRLYTRAKEAYRRNPVLVSLIAIIICVILIAALYYAVSFARTYAREAEARRLATLDLQAQLADLDQTKRELQSLIEFVTDQQVKIEQEQKLIESLQSEREELEPLLEADQATVQALLRAQEEAASRTRWQDHLIGFFLGIIGAVLFELWLAPRLLPKLRRYTSSNRPGTNSDDDLDSLSSGA